MVVVSNAKVLTEGVDVPAVDAVVFCQPRDEIDAVQAVGRALRTGGVAAKIATIVVPLMLAAGQSVEDALDNSVWEPVWTVINALRDHDERLDAELRARRRALGRESTPGTGQTRLPSWLTVTGVEVTDQFAAAITVQAVRAATASWDEYCGAAEAFRDTHGHLRIPPEYVTESSLRLGRWWLSQKDHVRYAPSGDERVQALVS
jgi:predicted helicase